MTFDAIADPMAPKLKTIKNCYYRIERGKKRERKGVKEKENVEKSSEYEIRVVNR